MTNGCPLPVAEPEVGLKVLKGLARERSLLTALEIMRQEVGPAFQITLPGFQPAVLVGPESNRQILVSRRAHFRSRGPGDPVTKLLRHGVLVEDGEAHDLFRAQMEPVLQKPQVVGHIGRMQQYTDRVAQNWRDGTVVDMLVEMRRLALLIFMGTLVDVEFGPDMERLWRPILRAIKYISPGLWIIWPDMPRFGYARALAQLDDYLYGLIRERRQRVAAEETGEPSASTAANATDLLTPMVRNPAMTDDLIRDQILTMLIAGHDTSTALLAWALHLLGLYPEIMDKARAEVASVVGGEDITLAHVDRLEYLDTVIKETLRLYPPIHVGNRFVTEDTTISGYDLTAGTRVMASIYLSHRDERYWDAPQEFCPERFGPDGARVPPFTYIPFGGGPRVCIGATFAQIEAKVVLARLIQQFTLTSEGRKVHPYMGATLEPHPGVFLRVQRRAGPR
ncbi:cytochrome P450 [Candidatus Promineifilum breve]|uniref:cytochrome P450 n=1 Tax=Candidatus Promineifilum breve TaxID=1806508 RepID=UPI0007C1D72F|nr:cytochrome P450 [Candidatus Promineifilum breve]